MSDLLPTSALLVWLATLFLHSSALLLLVGVLDRLRIVRELAAREWLWRIALFAGFVTATVLTPWSGPIAVPVVSAPTSRAAQTAIEQMPVNRTAISPREVAAREREASAATVVNNASVNHASERSFNRPSLDLLPVALLSIGSWLILAWLMVATIGGWSVWRSRRRLLAELRALPDHRDRELMRTVEALSATAGIAAPQVKSSRVWASPLVANQHLLCVPEWALIELDPVQRRAMLAHEIAHLRRRDPGWRVAVELARRALFFQPLAIYASRRLNEIAEIRCDEWAAQASERRALAQTIARCAEHCRYPNSPALAVAMAGPNSPLVDRVRRLIEENPMRPIHPVIIGGIAVVALIMVVAILPAVGIRFASAHGSSVKIETNSWFGGSMMQAEFDHGGGRIRAKVHGDIAFSDKEDDVASAANEGFIEETRDGTTRRFEFGPGTPNATRKYLVDGVAKPFDESAKKWLSEIVPALMRESGYHTKERVKRIFGQGGADAVLNEVALIEGEYARRSYLAELSATTKLEPAALARAIGLGSAINSDFERRTVFETLVEDQNLDAAGQAAILRGVASMDSDFEQRTVLASLAPKLVLDAAVRGAWLEAVTKLGSDFERREAITALAERSDLDPAGVKAALDAALGIRSDFELRTVLEALVGKVVHDPELALSYIKTAEHIGSDFDRRTALTSLLEAGQLEAAAYRAMLDAVGSMGSDFDQRTVLVEIASHMPGDADLIKRYREVARHLSTFDRGQAEEALDRFATI